MLTSRTKHVVAYVIVVIGLVVAVSYSYRNDHRDIARNCHSGQRSWDTLSAVVHTAYETRSLKVDAAKLPPETRALLASLAPLLKQSAGAGARTEQAVLSKLGPRPTC